MVTQVVPQLFHVNIKDDNIVCQAHELQVCESCQVNWKEQNEIAASIKQFNGQDLPVPNKAHNTTLNAQVSRLKMEGNRAYKEQKYQEAIDFYSLAVKVSWNRPLWEPLAFQFVREELSPILSNRSAAYVALESYAEALVDGEVVTRLKKDWSKGWFRKGKANFGLKRYQEAVQAYRVGLMYEQDSQDLLLALEETQAQEKEEE